MSQITHKFQIKEEYGLQVEQMEEVYKLKGELVNLGIEHFKLMVELGK